METAPKDEDRTQRRFPRAPVRGTAQLQLGQKRLAGEFTELSRGGALLCGIPPLEVGTEVRAFILLPPENVPFPVTMKILYNLPESTDRESSTGVAFVKAADATLERISRAVDRSNLLLLQLLFSLTAVQSDPIALQRMLQKAGLPPDKSNDELAELVKAALEKFKL